MRHFLKVAGIFLAVCISAAGGAFVAHAQVEFDTPQIQNQAQILDNVATGQSSATVGDALNNAAKKMVAGGGGKPSEEDFFASVMSRIVVLFAWLVGVAAIMLDNAVYFTVVKMGDYVNSLSAVGVTWTILRDIGNIFLIFGFLAVGITTILNVDWYGGGKKMLPMMLVAAVFLNFSLFIAEAFIDTGNLFATQFYTQINGGQPAGKKDFDPGDLNFRVSNEGISNKIMSQLGLQTIYGDVLAGRNVEILKAQNVFLVGFMSIILFLITAFVLFSLAFILIARFVALVLLVIISPIGFAGLAVPGMAERAKQWWTTLFEQTITAPILLLMLYIALSVITDDDFLRGFGVADPSAGYLTSFVANGNLQGFGSMILSFMVAMGLLIAVVIYSKRWSAFGGDMATKFAGKMTFGVAGQFGRTAVGWPAQFASKKFRSTKYARYPIVGRAVANILDRGAKGSFDVRGTGVFSKIPFGPVEAGESQKGGYREDLAKAVKGREEHAKTLHLSRREELATTVAEHAAEVAHDEYEASPKQAADRLRLKLAQKAVSDAKGVAQLGYAKWLDKKPWGWLSRNSEAAKNIRKTVEKSKDQQQIDALMNTIRNAAPAPAAPVAGDH